MKRHWVLGGVLGVYLLGLGACLPSGKVSVTGPAQAPREASCDFAVLTVPPASGFVEIGAIDFSQSFTGKMYSELDELKTAITPDVCKAGGDAAIALANGLGEYIKVTIVKRVPDAPARPVSAAPAAPPSAAAAVALKPAEDLGCHYDTQCKGDRICSDGKCVPPSAPPVAAAPAPAPAPSAAPPPAAPPKH